MVGLVLAPGERDPARIVQMLRQLAFGRCVSIGTCTLQASAGIATFTGAIFSSGGFTDGSYNNLPLIDGGQGDNTPITGNSAIGNVLVVGGVVTTFSLQYAGGGFVPGDIVGASGLVSTVGAIGIMHITNTGAAYPPGTYVGVALTGGTGAGATVQIIVNGAGNIISILAQNRGTGYLVGDVVSVAPFGGGAGLVAEVKITDFFVQVATADVLAYTSTQVAAINCGSNSAVFLFQQTFNAAQFFPSIYVSPSNVGPGGFTITHPATLSGDCTYYFDCRG